MSACERCWYMAHRPGISDPVSEYHRLLTTNRCTPEQQAGPGVTTCAACGRQTRHQHTGECMACGSLAGMEVTG